MAGDSLLFCCLRLNPQSLPSVAPDSDPDIQGPPHSVQVLNLILQILQLPNGWRTSPAPIVVAPVLGPFLGILVLVVLTERSMVICEIQ